MDVGALTVDWARTWFSDDPQTVGRLVAPDEGYGFDDETDSVGYDAGASGGGATAEELAIHETNPPPYE